MQNTVSHMDAYILFPRIESDSVSIQGKKITVLVYVKLVNQLTFKDVFHVGPS